MAGNYRQGIYEVKNKEKYVGVKNPRYMSSWELDFMRFLDDNPNIIKWGSEIVVVPYYSPVDERNRRYMVDIFMQYRNRHGDIKTELVEIKPFNQTQQPKQTKGKKKKTYLKEVYTYNVNQAKWNSASRYAKERGWTFRVITEKDIYK